MTREEYNYGNFINKNVIIPIDNVSVLVGRLSDVSISGCILRDVYWLDDCTGMWGGKQLYDGKKIEAFAACPRVGKWELVWAAPTLHVYHLKITDIYLLSDETEEWFEKNKQNEYKKSIRYIGGNHG